MKLVNEKVTIVKAVEGKIKTSYGAAVEPSTISYSVYVLVLVYTKVINVGEEAVLEWHRTPPKKVSHPKRQTSAFDQLQEKAKRVKQE